MSHAFFETNYARAASVFSMLLLALLATQATAGTLRKCVLPGGRHAYLDDACPAGSRELWQRDVAPDPAHAAALKRRLDEIEHWQSARLRQGSTRTRAGSGGGAFRASTAAREASRCERAKQRRDRIRDREWMRMTYDRMIELDADVSEACR